MKLKAIVTQLTGLSSSVPSEFLEREIKGLSTNSQTCQPGDLFIGMPGTKVDGGEFWSSALGNGAIAALITPNACLKRPPNPTDCVLVTEDIITDCARIAASFYGYPTQKLKLIGVTGTNGKTTTTHLIEFFLNQCQLPTVLLGTLYTRWANYQVTAVHTTPFAVELQSQLATALQAGNQWGVMEVSSHALAQGRVKNCGFAVAVFTNLTQDHLDFHRDMEDYFQAKSLLFTPDYLQGKAIINQDDAYGQRIISTLPRDQVWSYSVFDQKADFWTSDLVYSSNGVRGQLHTPVGVTSFASPLVGQFNLANLLGAIATALAVGLSLEEVIAHLPHFTGVPGRMERVQVTPEQEITVIVDYAHTPDSLENLLTAARPFITGKMICVVGCGGDRDRTKRPLMGKIVAQLADIAVITSDNPRTEDPEAIIQDILAGIPQGVVPLVISDRAEAIATAITTAQPGDGVLIAGKGHEDYQILGTEKIHFDDREQAREVLTKTNAVNPL
ncbi:UDP-N-acetylmuramoyl-L-alanyl-D-glutamate--2,6-diaminopimelate ligase [Gloeocapsa sp. PCC 73106]|uniref:UDP-N-acetylmuramoyl-L-alanyl-D-glutamate--2, 6-diaminopimelate ligase n=1 Tax=Gloeocapsa sp. PCC 73106 TaxID=102232 RepID=UPI0002AC3362|nr:UDP-N-acetylmuramoyl-L-alanyl-D-glutamate--2,6-diaminopimelate ligase [Gloeocapsa sp. PCC 73106]ELR96742.1 UDP-N-acetylmuramyl-tripeptide synthetase [Gloeocapsa sp. PCC 73106]